MFARDTERAHAPSRANDVKREEVTSLQHTVHVVTQSSIALVSSAVAVKHGT